MARHQPTPGRNRRTPRRRAANLVKQQQLPPRLPDQQAKFSVPVPEQRFRAGHWLIIALILLLSAVFATRQISSLDAGFHLQAGEHILAGKGWPDTDPFTFTVPTHAYTDMSWGYQVLLSLAQRTGDAPAIVLLHTVMVAGLFTLLLFTARLRPVNPAVLCLGLLLAVLACEQRFDIRPELASYVLLAVTLFVAHRNDVGKPGLLWMLPAIQLIWANTHSLFVLGWSAMVCFVAGAWLQGVWRRNLAIYSAAAAAVTLINPYVIEGVMFPFSLLTRFQENNLFAQSIGELVSPFALKLSTQFPFYPRVTVNAFRLFAVLSLIGLWPLLKSRRYGLLLLWLAFAPLGAKMIRNIPLLVIAAFPGTVWAWSELIRHWPWRRYARQIASALLVGAGVMAVVLMAWTINDTYYITTRRADRFGWEWNRSVLPAGLAEYVRQSGLRGNMLNHLNFGGYLMWALDRPVFIDGRLEVIGEDFYQHYLTVMNTPEELERAVSHYGIGYIALPYPTNPNLTSRLARDPKWRLGYADACGVVFFRPEVQDHEIPPPEFEPELPVNLDLLPGTGTADRISSWNRQLHGLWRKERFPTEDHYLGLFHLYLGDLTRAAGHIARGISESRGAYYELYNNLGAIYFRQGRYDEALRCYNVVLKERPDDRTVRQRVAEILRKQ